MANADFRYGLRPVEHLNGSPWNGVTRRARVTSTAGILGVGDPVIWNSAGSTRGYMEISRATAGATNKITGVITSFEPVETNLERLYIANADSGWANVCVDPDVIFSAQADGVLVPTTDIGNNVDFVVADADTATGLSKAEIESSSKGTNATYQLTIIGGVDKEDNDLTLTNAEWLVLINLHSFRDFAIAGV